MFLKKNDPKKGGPTNVPLFSHFSKNKTELRIRFFDFAHMFGWICNKIICNNNFFNWMDQIIQLDQPSSWFGMRNVLFHLSVQKVKIPAALRAENCCTQWWNSVFHDSVRKVPTSRTLRSVKIYFPRVVMKNIIRNLAEAVSALVSITTLASLGS